MAVKIQPNMVFYEEKKRPAETYRGNVNNVCVRGTYGSAAIIPPPRRDYLKAANTTLFEP